MFRHQCLGAVLVVATLTLSAMAQIQGTWSDGDPERTLADPHILGAAALLPNGQVLVAGGLSPKKLLLAADTLAELYDPTSRRWTPTGPLNTPRWSLDAVTLRNGKVLFAGGASAFAENASLDTAEVYDPETGKFAYTENNLSTARHGFGIGLLNDGRVLITGGSTAGNNLGGKGVTAVDLYDPETNSFRKAASLRFGRSLHAQTTLRDGRVVVIGGAQSTAEIYDPANDAWSTSSGNLPTTLKDMRAFELFDGRIFIAGGQNTVDGLTTDATWFFDPETGEFTPGPSLAGFNYAPNGVQVGCSDYSAWDLFSGDPKRRGRYILIAGGEHDPLEGPDVELHSAAIFDAARNVFIDVGPMPFVHDDHTESPLRMNEKGNPEAVLIGGNRSAGTSRFELDATSLPNR
jgi:hypothetical protein